MHFISNIYKNLWKIRFYFAFRKMLTESQHPMIMDYAHNLSLILLIPLVLFVLTTLVSRFQPGKRSVLTNALSFYASIAGLLSSVAGIGIVSYTGPVHMKLSEISGLDVYPAAMLHLIAHSFYKAHAFLSSGSTVEMMGASVVRPPKRLESVYRIAVSVGFAFAVYVGFGSGNKTLHNVTSGIGVLEGYSGDLRTELPWQSVHDGKKYQNIPRRLNVIIATSTEAINEILKKQLAVKQLLDNEWITMHIMYDEGIVAYRYQKNLQWEQLVDAEEMVQESESTMIQTHKKTNYLVIN